MTDYIEKEKSTLWTRFFLTQPLSIQASSHGCSSDSPLRTFLSPSSFHFHTGHESRLQLLIDSRSPHVLRLQWNTANLATRGGVMSKLQPYGKSSQN